MRGSILIVEQPQMRSAVASAAKRRILLITITTIFTHIITIITLTSRRRYKDHSTCYASHPIQDLRPQTLRLHTTIIITMRHTLTQRIIITITRPSLCQL